MSILAYDGKLIAADRQGTINDTRGTMKKLVKVGNVVIGWVGTQTNGLIMMRWFLDGADPAKFPETNDDPGTCSRLIVVSKKELILFEASPEPMKFLDKKQAFGSGMDLALGAMAMGANAKQAVQIACKYDIHCGMGIDWFEVR
jgi:hypothetical protein